MTLSYPHHFSCLCQNLCFPRTTTILVLFSNERVKKPITGLFTIPTLKPLYVPLVTAGTISVSISTGKGERGEKLNFCFFVKGLFKPLLRLIYNFEFISLFWRACLNNLQIFHFFSGHKTSNSVLGSSTARRNFPRKSARPGAK